VMSIAGLPEAGLVATPSGAQIIPLNFSGRERRAAFRETPWDAQSSG